MKKIELGDGRKFASKQIRCGVFKFGFAAFLATTSLTAASISTAFADEINSQSRISSVMVFPNGA